MLQHVQIVFILKHVITASEGYLRLGVLLASPPLSLFDKFLVT
jgi:hypothetical protein